MRIIVVAMLWLLPAASALAAPELTHWEWLNRLDIWALEKRVEALELAPDDTGDPDDSVVIPYSDAPATVFV